MNIYRIIKEIFKKEKILFISTFCIIIIFNIFEILGLLTLAPVIDLIGNIDSAKTSKITKFYFDFFKINNLDGILFYFILFILINIVIAIITIFSQYLILRLKYSYCGNLLSEIYKNIYNARWEFFTSEKQGNFINTITRELQIVGDLLAVIGRLGSACMQLAVFIILPFFLSIKITIFMILTSLILFLPLFKLTTLSKKLGFKNTAISANFINSIYESFIAVRSIILSGVSKQIIDNIKKKFDLNSKSGIKTTTVEIVLQAISLPLVSVALVLIYYLGIRDTDVSLSNVAIILVSFLRFLTKFKDVLHLKNTLERSISSFVNINNLNNKAKLNKQVFGKKVFSKVNKKIDFKDISFSYDKKSLFKNLTFSLPAKKITSIVGESGAGKSTLIDLLLGIKSPVAGKILIDNINLQEYSFLSLRKKVGLISQDDFLFNMSIIDNITWGSKKINYNRFYKATRIAEVDSFALNFEEKYNTIIGDKGSKLSSGQIQRISIARVLYKDPEIIVFDEGTNALDLFTESKILEKIFSLYKNRTIIIISHRYSTISKSNLVYVLKKGEIVDSGSLKYLISKRGYFFKKLYEKKNIN